MKINVLLWISVVFALISKAEDPPDAAPHASPRATPRVIVLESERDRLEVSRASAEKSYERGSMSKSSYDKGLKEYKEGIDRYRAEVKEAKGDG